jgi:hypothetical protein
VLPASGNCYSTGTSWTGVQEFYITQRAKFDSGDLDNLFGLDQFPLDDVQALVVGATMSLMQINMYEQLIMLGSPRGENATLKSFAGTAAAKLQQRYTYLTNITRLGEVVDTYSTVTKGHIPATSEWQHHAPVAV